METSTLGFLQIHRLHRDHAAEQEQQLVDKVEYYLRSCSAEVWARVFPGRVGDRDTFIYNSEQGKFCLNMPAAPWGANGIPPLAPRMETYRTTDFGTDETLIVSDSRAYPCLELARTKESTASANPYVFEAKQLAPALGLCGIWDEPELHQKGLRWQPSEIEYAMLERVPYRTLLVVKDYDGCIRHLIEFRQDTDAVLPLSFAQDATDYCVPMPCCFSFEPSWYLIHSEYLATFKKAKVIITGELGVVLGNKPDEYAVVLGYAFGYEMISKLKLEGLRHRNITLLVIESPDKKQFRENLKETVVLLSRFCELDIPVGIEYARYTDSTDEIVRRSYDVSGRNVELNFYNERYDMPFAISRDQLVKMAMSHQIYIPDNIRLDRLGRIPECSQTTLIDGLVDTGSTSVLLAHDGVDVSIVCGSIVAGIKQRSGSIFPGHWETTHSVPVVMTAAGSQAGIQKSVTGLRAGICDLYTLPSGSKVEIEQHLSAIRHEIGANLFIFSGSQILAEQKKMLEVAGIWAQKADVGILICTAVKSGSAAQDFLDETCKRQIHIIRLRSTDLAYLVKEDDPFSETPQMFKIVLTRGSWTSAEPTAGDMKDAEEQLPVSQDYDAKTVYQEDENQRKIQEMIEGEL